MVLNEILVKQNILNPLLVKAGNEELSKELKVKIVRLRIAYNKVKKQFDEDVQEFTKNLIPKELQKLQEIPEDKRTPEEIKKLEELVTKVNEEYREFIQQKYQEEISIKINDTFTDEEFDQIVAVNAGNDVIINENTHVKAEELMESFYLMFVDNKD